MSVFALSQSTTQIEAREKTGKPAKKGSGSFNPEFLADWAKTGVRVHFLGSVLRNLEKTGVEENSENRKTEVRVYFPKTKVSGSFNPDFRMLSPVSREAGR